MRLVSPHGSPAARKDTLTAEGLATAVGAASHGAGVVASDLLDGVLEAIPSTAAEKPELTEREQRVLTLIADGHPTREVAARLCYSERTVKTILHDLATKLNARSRTQAIALAVRNGLI